MERIAARQSTRLLKALQPRRTRPHGFTITQPRSFSTTLSREADFTHAIIGGGAVGLAIARHLTQHHPNTSTLLLERHGMVGSETSSRNSEVIHAGLYYGHGTLKTDLCLSGKRQLYDLCAKHGIPHRNTKKWIIAQDEAQMSELEKVHKFAGEVGYENVPTRWLSRREIEEREPDVCARAGVLESESTGIVDSHNYMQFLEADFLDRGGMEVLHTSVRRVEKLSTGGYRIFTRTQDPLMASSFGGATPEENESEDSIDVDVLINSAGLDAINLSNSILPAHRHIKPHFAKGTYFSYASSHPKPKTLLYPAPVPGHGGLGTHLTLDMSGRIRFGPDVEWIEDPSAPDALVPSSSRLEEAIEFIATYLPSVDKSAIDLDYCGIRPKLGKTSGTAGPTFADFYIKEEKDEGFPGFINLLGIESPGLTSSLAIAEYVDSILYGSGAVQGRNEDVDEAKRRGREGQHNHEFNH
ncbi:hypothetical protein PMZ80_003264 [Knufia obscura]|uniref:L-2-hydroxyglutarate dehydrogenase, mitochondrial n=2 Tax=Knufia TaxID=430999 RepID=A0AAN8F3B8_9EURO|nr:hypothetical protein PMZ80_003264 [Knufia obscura]KAK5950381.1 hypothetical protein OHC33_008600 [Knufia fluminis]